MRNSKRVAEDTNSKLTISGEAVFESSVPASGMTDALALSSFNFIDGLSHTSVNLDFVDEKLEASFQVGINHFDTLFTSAGGSVAITDNINILVGVGHNLNKELDLLGKTVLVGLSYLDSINENGPVVGTVGVQYKADMFNLYFELGHGLQNVADDTLYYRVNGQTRFESNGVTGEISATVLNSNQDGTGISGMLGGLIPEVDHVLTDSRVFTLEVDLSRPVMNGVDLSLDVDYSQASTDVSVSALGITSEKELERSSTHVQVKGENNLGEVVASYRSSEGNNYESTDWMIGGLYCYNSTWCFGVNQSSISASYKGDIPSGCSSDCVNEITEEEFDQTKLVAVANVSGSDGARVEVGFLWTTDALDQTERSISLKLLLKNQCGVECH